MTLLACLLLFQADPGPILRKHCFECHDAETKKGNLNLESLPRDAAGTWLRVYERVRDGEMPPKAKIPELEKKLLLDALAEPLAAADRKQSRSSLRRMTRIEYENTLRDLFDLRVTNG